MFQLISWIDVVVRPRPMKTLINNISQFEGLLRAVLRDEMIAWHKKRYDERNVSQMTSPQVGLATQPPEIERLVEELSYAQLFFYP